MVLVIYFKFLQLQHYESNFSLHFDQKESRTCSVVHRTKLSVSLFLIKNGPSLLIGYFDGPSDQYGTLNDAPLQ